jgi:hypothetical protein
MTGLSRPDLLVLGDAWERSYGELGWRNLIPERVMPWYFATFDQRACHAYGVKTDARALCFWQLDSEGVTLWLNVTNGGDGVELGKRRLAMATVVAHRSADDRDSVQAIKELCRKMCARTTRQIQPVYGANDWCYSYGHSTSDSILRDTELIVELSPSVAVRPFSVVDGGWENATPAWPDMAKLASEIKRRTARPGIWIRPLEAPAATPARLLLPDTRFGDKKGRAQEHAYDPTVPEACRLIRSKVREVLAWGYELVKHDFSTYDLLGQWGFEMGPQPTLDLLARSGVATFVAPGPMAHKQEQRSALREAFAIAAAGGLGAVPEDWMETSVAQHWRGESSNKTRWSYNWRGAGGEMPFLGS